MTGQLTEITPTEVERVTGVFQRFPSIPRLFRDVIVTEKIDGTNASIFIGEHGEVQAASRTRWITPEDDNYGFAAWVEKYRDALRWSLGVGHHYGEWFGSGIQRKYGLSNGDKRFALFNVQRWLTPHNATILSPEQLEKAHALPDIPGLTVVPIIGQGPFDTQIVRMLADNMREHGSFAVPGFMKPEGVVVYHTKADQLFKYTFDKNDGHKGA